MESDIRHHGSFPDRLQGKLICHLYRASFTSSPPFTLLPLSPRNMHWNSVRSLQASRRTPMHIVFGTSFFVNLQEVLNTMNMGDHTQHISKHLCTAVDSFVHALRWHIEGLGPGCCIGKANAGLEESLLDNSHFLLRLSFLLSLPIKHNREFISSSDWEVKKAARKLHMEYEMHSRRGPLMDPIQVSQGWNHWKAGTPSGAVDWFLAKNAQETSAKETECSLFPEINGPAISQVPQKLPDWEQVAMASHSQGIHQLLQAEKRAKDKLDEAKKRKGKRLKQAKEEAMAEIDQYRMEREKELRLRESKTMGSQSNISDELEDQTRHKIQELNGSYNRCVESVTAQLLSMVCDMKPEIHVNYRATN
ncbi:V-type proton ATPase subunit G 3 [Fukomys damarensis]|uniref:V-type proton ATPase subunit G 3 n=2 Tax=Fukomys damarensis TaxID=885580 RepID=A0A091D901_FUKDA|nr:V-type proton ATPase subunit G 3 [Fukomys damarensis]